MGNTFSDFEDYRRGFHSVHTKCFVCRRTVVNHLLPLELPCGHHMCEVCVKECLARRRTETTATPKPTLTFHLADFDERMRRVHNK